MFHVKQEDLFWYLKTKGRILTELNPSLDIALVTHNDRNCHEQGAVKSGEIDGDNYDNR